LQVGCACPLACVSFFTGSLVGDAGAFRPPQAAPIALLRGNSPTTRGLDFQLSRCNPGPMLWSHGMRLRLAVYKHPFSEAMRGQLMQPPLSHLSALQLSCNSGDQPVMHRSCHVPSWPFADVLFRSDLAACGKRRMCMEHGAAPAHRRRTLGACCSCQTKGCTIPFTCVHMSRPTVCGNSSLYPL